MIFNFVVIYLPLHLRLATDLFMMDLIENLCGLCKPFLLGHSEEVHLQSVVLLSYNVLLLLPFFIFNFRT